MPGRSRFNELGEASDGRRWRETPPLAPPLAPRSIFGGRMKFSFVRLVATLLLSGQMLPVGLPLLCEQVQRGTAANCEQQMASHPFGPVVDARTHTSPCANPALGQGSAAPVAGDSGLQSLVAEALDRNPTVAQRQAAVRAANLRIRPAGTLPDPMLTVGVMDLLLPHFEFNRSDFTEVDVELSQEIPWPGSLGARSGVVRAAAAGARAEEGAVRRELTAAMAVAYYRLGYTGTALETLRHQRDLLEAGVPLSTTRYATSAAPQSDPLQAKPARDPLPSEAFALESERVAALAAVDALRNRTPGDPLRVAPMDPPEVRAGISSLPRSDSLVALAL